MSSAVSHGRRSSNKPRWRGMQTKIPSQMRSTDLGKNLRQIATSPVCWIWVAAVLGVQTAVSLAGGHGNPAVNWWFNAFGLSNEGILSGNFWQLFSYGILHGGWLHVGLNSLVLLIVGSRIEHILGREAVWKTLSFGILGGGIGHVLLVPWTKDEPLLVGISGGCVALLILLTTLSPGSRMVPLPVSGRSLGIGLLAAELLLALINPALRLPGFADVGNWLQNHGMASWFQIGHACHFGGGIAGWCVGRWILRPRITLARLRRERERREARCCEKPRLDVD